MDKMQFFSCYCYSEMLDRWIMGWMLPYRIEYWAKQSWNTFLFFLLLGWIGCMHHLPTYLPTYIARLYLSFFERSGSGGMTVLHGQFVGNESTRNHCSGGLFAGGT